jgi:HYR domain
MPTATDDSDPSPAVACDPMPGALVPVGSTTVTCRATDAAGNTASATFRVTVHLARVLWDSPIGSDDGIVATHGRSLPIKVQAVLDGMLLKGPASLEIRPCGSDAERAPMASMPVAWQRGPGRWMDVVDTSRLGMGCQSVSLVVKGMTLGSFRLQLVGSVSGAIGGSHRPR